MCKASSCCTPSSRRPETVENLQVVSGPPPLLVSAIDAVRQWKYKPYLLNGEPTAVDTIININYTLEGSADTQGEKQYEGVPPKKIGGNVSAPVVIYQVEPEFTEDARKAKFMGIVLVNLIVDQEGRPQNVHILRGVGMGLDAKAVEAVKQYRFKPAMESGKPVPVELNVEVNFQIFDKPTTGASAALHFPFRTAMPVLMASLNPIQFPLSRMILGGRRQCLSRPRCLKRPQPRSRLRHLKRLRLSQSLLVLGRHGKA